MVIINQNDGASLSAWPDSRVDEFELGDRPEFAVQLPAGMVRGSKHLKPGTNVDTAFQTLSLDSIEVSCAIKPQIRSSTRFSATELERASRAASEMGIAIHGAARDALAQLRDGVIAEVAAKRLGAIIKAQAGVLREHNQGSIAELRARFGAITTNAEALERQADRLLPHMPEGQLLADLVMSRRQRSAVRLYLSAFAAWRRCLLALDDAANPVTAPEQDSGHASASNGSGVQP